MIHLKKIKLKLIKEEEKTTKPLQKKFYNICTDKKKIEGPLKTYLSKGNEGCNLSEPPFWAAGTPCRVGI